MAKISMFRCFFLFVLIAMPISSSGSRMMLGIDLLAPICSKVAPICGVGLCEAPTAPCPPLVCAEGFVLYQPCCGCEICCPKLPLN
ncbi:hypothetical protein MKW92_013832 [Papaver armeniacum]|nr:hypothetical protein MKW92_013832 [Papaver armeniacum]